MSNISILSNKHVAYLTIERPYALNALNRDVLIEIKEAIEQIDESTCWCLVIKGSGNKAFVAGADISEMALMKQQDALEFSRFGNSVFTMISNLPIPTIAMINGYTLGGGLELALACDFRICSRKSVFGQPETGLGIIPGFGGTQRLSRIVGCSKAKELIFSGKRITAVEAEKIGLVNKVSEQESLDEETEEFINAFINNAPIAIRRAKQAVNQGFEMDLSKALNLESELFASTFDTQDQIEGMAAFVEKRKHRPFSNQ